jgi:hypothetical protein
MKPAYSVTTRRGGMEEDCAGKNYGNREAYSYVCQLWPVYFGGRVIAPCEADSTSAAYLANTPVG